MAPVPGRPSVIRRVWRYLRTAVTAVAGDLRKRKAHRDLVRALPEPRETLPGVGPAAELPTGDAPVFLFAPTWRSGSTLLQRLVMSTGEIWMWGEVYTQAEPLQRMMGIFRPFREDFPDPGLFTDPGLAPGELTGDWIARLSPRPRHLMEAHRAFWDRLCAGPARDRGCARWGLKAVNLPVDYPVYLKRLYPDARLIFLVRNPYRAWLSYRRWADWYARFPDDPVFTVQRFARMWSEHTAQFLRYAAAADDVLLIRFEDLVRGGEVLDELSEHVGSRVDPAVLDRKVAGTGAERASTTTVVERLVLRRFTRGPAEELGYEAV